MHLRMSTFLNFPNLHCAAIRFMQCPRVSRRSDTPTRLEARATSTAIASPNYNCEKFVLLCRVYSMHSNSRNRTRRTRVGHWNVRKKSGWSQVPGGADHPPGTWAQVPGGADHPPGTCSQVPGGADHPPGKSGVMRRGPTPGSGLPLLYCVKGVTRLSMLC